MAILAAGFLVFTVEGRRAAEREFNRQIVLADETAERLRREVVLFTDLRVPAGVTLGQALLTMGVAPLAANDIVDSIRPILNPRYFRAGSKLTIGRSVLGEIRGVRYQLDADRMLWVTPEEGRYRAEIRSIPTTNETVGVSGEIRDALFNAVRDAGESPELALKLAEIFGWDLDFYTDPQPGDTFRLIVEKKKYMDGSTASYGRILAAEYVNAGRPYQAVLFRDPDGAPAYYRPDGNSLQKAFLRSPLKFAARITSHFSRSRFHPILKIYRPHYGIDFGAPMGTPVQTIGGGRVLFAGSKGGAGGLVHVRHTNGYETMYLHLSRILVRTGQQVFQGQNIGLVGSTGHSTGPHLDFRILQHGQYRNFERLNLPPANPVAKREWGEFAAVRDRWVNLLPDPNRPQQAATASAPQGTQPPSAPSSPDNR